jgi:hypothetical protein
MDARGSREPRDIRAIVHDQKGSMWTRQPLEARGQFEERAAGYRLRAELQPPRTAGQAGDCQVRQRPAGASGNVGVKDRVQARDSRLVTRGGWLAA